jgi:uncharacterized repeat protein (TIGR03803 family)
MSAQVRAGGLIALASFNLTNGAIPQTGVIFDASGNLYGTTAVLGANGSGTVWELAKGSSTITALAFFNGTNGAAPSGRVTFDANGNLFGTALSGGANDNGTVWELAKGSSTITPLASFNGTNGFGPVGVTFDASGNLYGTTAGGGAKGVGTVWELAKGSSTIITLAPFDGFNGRESTSGVTFDASGNLYGTARNGGASGFGTVWELAKGSSTITALASFNLTNGVEPTSGVTIDANGNLFGATFGGGASFHGTVWELAKGSGVITPLASFNGTNGGGPSGGVTIDANGNLFGTTAGGGANTVGTVWELAKGSGVITLLASFNGTNGSDPVAGVTFDANGNLYGTASEGGASGVGTVWEFSLSSIPEPSSLILGLISLAVAGGAALLKHHRRSLLDRVFTRFVRKNP